MGPVGILALQGGYAAHARCLTAIDMPWRLVRTEEQLDGCRGLILPGGESTTHLKLIDRFSLEDSLTRFVQSGRPVLATCAGLILAASRVDGPTQRAFGWIDVRVERNGWGRQVNSFKAQLEVPCLRDTDQSDRPAEVLFIRAPRITTVGPNIEVLARLNNEPIVVRQGRMIGMTCHPELTNETRFHSLAFKDQLDSED